MRFYYLLVIFYLFFSQSVQAQSQQWVSGIITDEAGKPINQVTVTILNQTKTVLSDSTGFFTIQIPLFKPLALVFNKKAYREWQQNVHLTKASPLFLRITLKPAVQQLQDVVVTDEKERREAGKLQLDASKAIVNPSPIGGIESLIKTLVGSNNELSSQYNVRGGSYDENLVVVNDFEIFRPYLVSSGQQEGLSFINPELTGNVKFYTGGFAAKYGDKLSSVLDISYFKPKQMQGGAYIGLLEQGIHFGGISNSNKFSYLFGARNRSNRNLLNSQSTRGNYIPSSADVQTLLTYQFSKKWNAELLLNFSSTRFQFFPEESKLTSAVFTNNYASFLGVNTFFEGQEKDNYRTNFVGFSIANQPNARLRLKWMFSRLVNTESENVDITGSYIFGDIEMNRSSSQFGNIVNPLGAGVYQNFSRNSLQIGVTSWQHKGSIDVHKQTIQWGLQYERQTVNDRLNEWQYNDSAGYSLPFNPSSLLLFQSLKGNASFVANRFSGYLQSNWQIPSSQKMILQYGVRWNYNSLNNEWLVSPRVNFSWKPNWKNKDVVLKTAIGLYQQPPFYREMRKPNGQINTRLLAQKSWQAIVGADYQFTMFQRPAKLTTEFYYKQLWDVVPYDIDNVRMRYFGDNVAKAYAAGWETRIYGELVKDAESWISIGIMRTREQINNFNYFLYKNAAGEFINSQTEDQVVADSVLQTTGWMRRPTDRLVTVGMFLQDYLSNNKNIKLYLNMIYGANLPYNIPGSVRYRNALQIDPYIRVDIGCSAVLFDANKNQLRKYNPFKSFQSIWLNAEVFNLIDRANTISYLLIKDFSNNTFAMPNRLTARLFNVKLIVKW